MKLVKRNLGLKSIFLYTILYFSLILRDYFVSPFLTRQEMRSNASQVQKEIT